METTVKPVKSGKFWVTWANDNAPNSSSISTLEPDFKAKASSFIAALEAAGAKVTVKSTRRSDKRAYLFHWSWLIALQKCKPSEATPMKGVDILWDHKNDAASIAGAMEIVKGFGLAVPPSSTNAPALTSNHITGKAIDMDIVWKGKIKVKTKEGTEVEIAYATNPNTNTKLHSVGKSYGVLKLTTDAPHWSFNGR